MGISFAHEFLTICLQTYANKLSSCRSRLYLKIDGLILHVLRSMDSMIALRSYNDFVGVLNFEGVDILTSGKRIYLFLPCDIAEKLFVLKP